MSDDATDKPRSITVTGEAHEALREWAFHDRRTQQELASVAILEATSSRADDRYREQLQAKRQTAKQEGN